MVKPFMRSLHFKCPKCGAEGTLAKHQGQEKFRLVGDQFRLEQCDGEQEIICELCDVVALPMNPDDVKP